MSEVLSTLKEMASDFDRTGQLPPMYARKLFALISDLLAVLEAQGHDKVEPLDWPPFCGSVTHDRDFEKSWPCPAAVAIAKAKGEAK